MSSDLRLLDLLTGDVLIAARGLLGAELTVGSCQVRIIETEAYRAADDPGSHAARGQTPRNAVMFGPPGHAYVYFCYGVHWMLNITAHPPGEAAAILIRAACPLEGIEEMMVRRKTSRPKDLLSGPGKICQAMAVGAAHQGLNLLDPSSEIRLEPGEPAKAILVGTRVGLAPGKGEDLPWRFVHAEYADWASRPKLK